MVHQLNNPGIFSLRQITGDWLVIDIREETVQEAGGRIIGISGLIRLRMMHVMGNDIDLFRNNIDGQVLRNKSPEPVPESVCIVRAVPVMPDSAMRTHHDHAVKKSHSQQVKIKVLEREDKKAWDQQNYPGPAGKSQPVLPGPENIQTEKELFQQLPGRGNDQAVFRVLPSIGRLFQYMIH
jgi:hypothetical protein